MVRGVTEGQDQWQRCSQNGQQIDFLRGDMLQDELQEAKMVISRSGYTSIMDYIVLGVKALVVPTPGQYEQEYLAEHLTPHIPMLAQNESQLDIREAYKYLSDITFQHVYHMDKMKQVLDSSLEFPPSRKD